MTSSAGPTRSLPLRILYAVNSSPQYILAKSPGACSVDIIYTDPHSPTFGSALLKDCLLAIRRGSPDIFDGSRDFTVYALDPLEKHSAPAAVQISASGSQSNHASSDLPGVAVGLGLMSWALSAEDEPVKVVGTLKTGVQESLEVVFALREVCHCIFRPGARPSRHPPRLLPTRAPCGTTHSQVLPLVNFRSSSA